MFRQAAFTLFEVLLAISILAILATLSLPSFQALLMKVNNEALQRDLSHAIQFAEQQSQAYGKEVVLCPSKDGHSCDADWQGKLLTFLNEHNDEHVHEAQQILSVSHLSHFRGVLHWRGYPYFHHYLHFSNFVNDDGTFWFCSLRESSPNWALTLNKAGSLRVVNRNRNGVIKDSRGRSLVC